MRKDKGLNGDADRLPILTWIMFLKFLDDNEQMHETEALLKEIIKKAHDEVWVYFDPNHDGELTNEEFYYFIKQNFKVVKNNVSFWKLLSATLLQPNVSQIIENDFDEKTIQYSAMLLDFFKRNKCENPEEELMIFTALIKGVTIMFVGNPKLIPLDKYESAILNFYKKKFK